MAVSQCFGYPRVLGTPVPKTLVFWVSPVGIPKTLIPGAKSIPNSRLGQKIFLQVCYFILIILVRIKGQDAIYFTKCSHNRKSIALQRMSDQYVRQNLWENIYTYKL